MGPGAVLILALLATMLLSGVGFAATQRLLASPKELLLFQLEHGAAADAEPRTISGSLSFSLNGTTDELGPLAALSGAPVTMDVALAPSQRQLRVGLDAEHGGRAVAGNLYADEQKLVLQGKGLVPILEMITPADLSDMPQYLILTGADVEKGLGEFWQGVREGTRRQAAAPQGASGQSLARFMLEAVPDRFFRRTQWNEVQLVFGQADVVEIVQSVVSQCYDEPETAADLMADVLAPASGAEGERERIRAEILEELQPEKRAATMEEIPSAFGGERPFWLDQTVMTMGWSPTSGAVWSSEGRISLVDGGDRLGWMEYRFTALPVEPDAIGFPTLTEANSMNAEDYMEQKWTGMAEEGTSWETDAALTAYPSAREYGNGTVPSSATIDGDRLEQGSVNGPNSVYSPSVERYAPWHMDAPAHTASPSEVYSSAGSRYNEETGGSDSRTSGSYGSGSYGSGSYGSGAYAWGPYGSSSHTPGMNGTGADGSGTQGSGSSTSGPQDWGIYGAKPQGPSANGAGSSQPERTTPVTQPCASLTYWTCP